MYTEEITKICSQEWIRVPAKKFKFKVKSLERLLFTTLSSEDELSNLRFLQKEVRSLAGIDEGSYISVTKSREPALGLILSCLSTRELTSTCVLSCISKTAMHRYINSMDIDTAVWQAKYMVIKQYIASGEKSPAEIQEKLQKLSSISQYEISSALNPIERALSADPLYKSMTEPTRASYRRMTAQIAIATSRDELRLAKEFILRAQNKVYTANEKKLKSYSFYYTNTAEELAAEEPCEAAECVHIGQVIYDEYRTIFPLKSIRPYAFTMSIITLALSCVVGYFYGVWAGVLFFLPAVALIKPIFDLSVNRTAWVINPPAAIELAGHIPKNAKTLCVISTLLGKEEDCLDGLEKLKAVQLKNTTDHLTYCLLADLMPSDTATSEKDSAILAKAKSVFADQPNFAVIVRERSYSKTQKTWQGNERKRGAILSLVRHLKSGGKTNEDFRAVYGDTSAFEDVKYICALDYDTIPLMDSISELVGIAEHPLNEKIGIIAPRMTTTLSSYLKSGFSRAMTSNGGTAGASTYDSFAAEMYQDTFGEGTFTGKGLINVEIFYDTCSDEKDFPHERVLSHDILEGGHTGVVYAGNVEFSDNFPETSSSYFKRQHRWLRGDLQNLPQIFRKKFSSLTRFKLTDNVRRALTPIFSLALFIFGIGTGNAVFTVCAVLSIVMPYLMGFFPSLIKGWRFSNYRKFYSPVTSQTKQLIRQLSLEIMLMPKNALVSLDAAVRSFWRMAVTKRHLLDWTTFSTFGKGKSGHTHMLGAEILSVAILVFAVLRGDIFAAVIAVMFTAAYPVMVWLDNAVGESEQHLSPEMSDELVRQSRKMWQFYCDFVTEQQNFLPPDNVQYAPVYRVSCRTSPTNIGMYLLSVLSVYYLDIITRQEMIQRIEQTLSTVEKLKKWHGNLMNWYDTQTLDTISPFVSSVDSGNFVCSLVAVAAALRKENASTELLNRVEEIIENTDLTAFYNAPKNLFSIGFDVEKKELLPHHYDLLMSEARMMSYFAISTGQAKKSHWRSLGRTMGKDGSYAAPIAWTGTMFEYFMPELLLKTQRGSLQYESLRFSLHTQKKRAHKLGVPFGISESGYYAFDNQLNYQYKAHGVAAAGLKEGLDTECVVSPYSSFLALQFDTVGAYNNLVRLDEMGMSHERYGFYEAVDFTPKRVGDGHAIIKSHMAHHVGMSIAGVANTLKDGVLQELFMSDRRMKRAEELLEEKIIAGETILGEPERQKGDGSYMNIEEFNTFSLRSPQVTALANGSLTLLCTDNGIQQTLYNRLSNVRATTDLLNPRGSIYGFVENEHYMPFFHHPLQDDEVRFAQQRTVFNQNTVEYYRNYRNLLLGMQVFLHPSQPIEIRRFSAENTSTFKRQLTLAVYLEPTLARNADVEAHPAFCDMFVSVFHDSKNNLIIAKRKDRHSDKEVFMAVGTLEPVDMSYSFNRENTVKRNGGILSVFEKASDRVNDISHVPSPCIFLKIDFPLDANEKKDLELFYCYGNSHEEVVSLASNHRFLHANPSEDIVSPLIFGTLYGVMIRRILPCLLYTPETDREAVMANTRDIKALWRFKISGDLPIVTFVFGKGSGCIDAVLQAKKALSVCQIDFDLVILYTQPQQRQLSEKLMGEIGTNAFVLNMEELPSDIVTLIRAVSVFIIDGNSTIARSSTSQSAPKQKELDYLPLEKAKRVLSDDVQNHFTEKGDKYVINQTPDLPWCNVLANSQFGTLLSDSSLGFSWALNSRENKLTPWHNDLCSDNKGERLVVKSGGTLYDIIDGSTATFGANRADYSGIIRNISAKTSVRVFEKGMGKELTVTLTNNSKVTKTLNLAYYTEPVLGVDRKRSKLIKPYRKANMLCLEMPANDVFSGTMGICADRTAHFVTNRHDFFEGEWKGDTVQPNEEICGAVVVKIELPPKHTDKVRFILSFTKNTARPETMNDALIPCGYANGFVGGDINIGNEKLSKLYKYWLPWQAIGCRMYARTGFYQNGGAFGYRDQLQDSLAALEIAPDITKRQIVNASCSQFIDGDVLHWWHRLMNKRKGVRTRYSDDLLWLPYVLCRYVDKTGDKSILDLKTSYCEAEELRPHEHEKYVEVTSSTYREDIYNHAKRAMEKAYKKGRHGLLLMGCGDWCDGYNNVGIEGKGESVWLSMFYALLCYEFGKLALIREDELYTNKLAKRAEHLRRAIDDEAWDGEYYLRAFYDNGKPMGSKDNSLCKIDLLPQAFSVLSSMPDEGRKISAMTSAVENLVDTQAGIVKLFTPPFEREKTSQRPGYVMSYPPGLRENGGQYTHAAIWLALAAEKCGMHEMALSLAEMIAPFDRPQEYKTEPYYLAADVYTNPKAYGRGGWSIYTGSASWYYQLLGELDNPTLEQ